MGEICTFTDQFTLITKLSTDNTFTVARAYHKTKYFFSNWVRAEKEKEKVLGRSVMKGSPTTE